MKPESEPLTPDEWLIRLVWETKMKQNGALVAANAFEPLPNDVDGLSLFRAACLNEPADTLSVIAVEKRSRYGIVQIPVSLTTELGLTVQPSPIPEVAGHVVIPELKVATFQTEKTRLLPALVRLAEVATQNIVRRPGAQ